MDQLTAKYQFTTIATRIDVYTRIGCDSNTTTIRKGMDICVALNGMTFVVYILTRMLLLLSFVEIKFDEIDCDLDKMSNFECDYGGNSNLTIIIESMYKICSEGFVVAFVVSIIYHNMEIIDASPSNITILAESDAVILAIAQSGLNLAMQSSIHAVYFDAQVIHNVCCVFLFFFVLLFFFLLFFFEFVCGILLIKYENIKTNIPYMTKYSLSAFLWIN